MRILAFDTSTEWCSVAVGDGEHWHRCDEHVGQGHAERLLVMVDDALRAAGCVLRDMGAIAFGAGPGSFTGVRIGCGVAQGLALGAQLPVVPVPTLAALAQEVYRERGWRRVLACLDARMREVYVATYVREGDAWREAHAASVVPPDSVEVPADERVGEWSGAGNGFAAYPALAGRICLSAVDAQARPTAQAVGELALPRARAGEGVAAADALPLYVRHRVALTTAEREAGVKL